MTLPTIEQVKEAVKDLKEFNEYRRVGNGDNICRGMDTLISLAEHVIENGYALSEEEIESYLSKIRVNDSEMGFCYSLDDYGMHINCKDKDNCCKGGKGILVKDITQALVKKQKGEI